MRNRPATFVIAAAWITMAALLATAKAPPATDAVEVNIKNLTFIPEKVTIKVGQTVRWTNNDDRDYLLVARDQSFKSGEMRPKDKFERKFTEAGTVEYSCALHPRLLGTVVGEEKK